MKKVFFRCDSSCFTHLLLLFTGKTNMQKFYMGTSTGRLRDPVAGHPGDEILTLQEKVNTSKNLS